MCIYIVSNCISVLNAVNKQIAEDDGNIKFNFVFIAALLVYRDLMDAKQHIVKGLLSSPRYIPPVYMYDEDGIKYYERVQRESPHYYVHREELQLLRNNIQVKRGADWDYMYISLNSKFILYQ